MSDTIEQMEKMEQTNEQFQPVGIDLILAITASLAMPFIVGWIFNLIGALISLIIYYGIFCFAIPLWRKGTLNYSIPKKFFTKGFFIVLVFELIRMILASLTLIRVKNVNPIGFLLTLLIWAPLNAFSEQLLWIYVYESFSNYPKNDKNKKIFTVIGLIIYILLIAFIHIFFWAQFLLESESIFPYSMFFILVNFAISIGYLFLYKKSKSMLQIFILHLIGDVSGVLIAGYSIIPYLFTI